MFPPGVRSQEQAASYFLKWLNSLGGAIDPPHARVFDRVDGGRDPVLLLGPFDVLFDSGTVLTIQLMQTRQRQAHFVVDTEGMLAESVHQSGEPSLVDRLEPATALRRDRLLD